MVQCGHGRAGRTRLAPAGSRWRRCGMLRRRAAPASSAGAPRHLPTWALRQVGATRPPWRIRLQQGARPGEAQSFHDEQRFGNDGATSGAGALSGSRPGATPRSPGPVRSLRTSRAALRSRLSQRAAGGPGGGLLPGTHRSADGDVCCLQRRSARPVSLWLWQAGKGTRRAALGDVHPGLPCGVAALMSWHRSEAGRTPGWKAVAWSPAPCEFLERAEPGWRSWRSPALRMTF